METALTVSERSLEGMQMQELQVMHPGLRGGWGRAGEGTPNPEKENNIVTEQLRKLTGIRINETNGTAGSACSPCAQ